MEALRRGDAAKSSNINPHYAVIRLFALLALGLWSCAAVRAQTTNEEIHLRAVVRDVIPLPSFSGKAIAVDVDPRFALTLRIESASPAVTNFAAGGEMTFAIHSPVKLFGGEAAKGKTFDFSLRRKTEHGREKYFDLKIQKAQAGRGAAPHFKSQISNLKSPIAAGLRPLARVADKPRYPCSQSARG